ncbi:SDR family oxidoreductase [Comamonas piscis]|uniref:SDR family oxidoreductase n=1 Tax=Comamonas piscis TaxID=1562974 RepID=A0A7G5EH02_9BURK|nr:SDR family NAD(P)-dependent oxidoreductase [Comamonas piscis]QMV73277.1 SDR family oxidoreductase [Comamonas piscis]WSO36076.1 SDR family NAD(P)-dependent oxidoreductase [Comamonas piscis]
MGGILVTGAARGIGRAIALRLAQDAQDQGGRAQLTLLDQHAAELDVLAAELQDLGAQVQVLAGDLSGLDFAAQAVAAAVQHWGGLDGLVSNAGAAFPGALSDYPVADWDRTFALNARAPLLLAQAALAPLRASGGSIVVITSVSASHATPPLGAYSASKAAALMLVRQLATEWGPLGVRINALSPGLIATPGTALAYADPAAKAHREQRVPLRRIGEPGDIAGAVSFLLSDAAAYINGAELVVDGGLAHTMMASLPQQAWQDQAAQRRLPQATAAG